MKKWFCPECGRLGLANYTPTCDSCDYTVTMVQVSDRVYGRLGTLKWTEAEYRREHNGVIIVGGDGRL